MTAIQNGAVATVIRLRASVQEIVVRFPADVQTNSGVHPASYQKG